MKKITIILTILMLAYSDVAFSQDIKAPEKTPIKPALLVIDVQKTYLLSVPERDQEIAFHYINGLIDLFRSQGCPVIRIYHYSKEYGPEPDNEQFEFSSAVKIKPEDAKVIKTYPDGFNKTELDKVLREKGCNTVFLCGLSAVGCVLATWIGAMNHDYKAFLVKDAMMSHNPVYTDNVEVMFDAVSYDMVKLILENSAK
jgi:nicotinamidase-related amidase